MAAAHKCDICGVLYEGYDTDRIAIGRYPGAFDSLRIDLDICPDCKESFEWWKASRNPDHKTAFEDKEDPIVYGNLFDGD